MPGGKNLDFACEKVNEKDPGKTMDDGDWKWKWNVMVEIHVKCLPEKCAKYQFHSTHDAFLICTEYYSFERTVININQILWNQHFINSFSKLV